MRFVGDIALDAEVRAIASGAITDGEPVIVNSTGTVSACVDASGGFGTAVEFESGDTRSPEGPINGTFDSNSNKVVIGYRDNGNSNYGTAVVATIDPSDNSVSYGTPVVFESGNVGYLDLSFDSNVNKVAIAYHDVDDSYSCKAVIGTVSGTGISFGSIVTFATRSGANSVLNNTLAFDSNTNKTAVFYVDFDDSQKLFCRVMSISGTTPSFGSVVEVCGSTQYGGGALAATFDSNSNKVVIFYIDATDSNKGKARVGTISGTDISFGTAAVFETGAYPFSMSCAFDSTNNKTVNIYRDNSNSDYGTATVGTVSGTDISFGTPVVYTSHAVNVQGCVYDSSVNRIVVLYRNSAVGDKGWYNVAQVSGTTLSFGTAAVYLDFATGDVAEGTYDSNAERILLPYRDTQDSNKGKAVVMQTPVAGNLTTENFIGFAHAAYANGQKATVKTTGSIARNIPQLTSASSLVGTEVQFEAGDTRNTDATFDSNSNRIVIVYRDVGNSSYGSVVVGTVDPSDNSISFGTPVVFESANSEVGDVVFDSSNNKVVVFYTDNGNSSYGTAIVGTVDSSDNSISFGSATTFLDATSYYYGIDATFDNSNNKIVIAYRDGGDSNKGKAKVGTVSGTSISFGSATEFEAGTTAWIGSTFDTSNNKVVITYQDAGNSDYGTAVVGTVSGTSISFGTPVVFASNASLYTSSVFDSDNSKIVIAYQNNSVSPAQPFAIVGTVSGTSISFGTAVTAGSSFVGIYTHAVYNSNAKKTVVSWADSSDTKGRFSSLSVSGTSITWDTATLYNNGSSDWNAIAFDSSNNRVVIPWAETAGKAVVVKSLGTSEDLTIGQQYFVQTDGTLGTSADDPSVIAGTAIGTSDIIVKG